MIIILGDPDDLSAAYVAWLAERRGLDFVPLREDRFGLDWWFSIDRRDTIRMVCSPRELTLRDVTGAFVRLHPEPSVPDELGIAEDLRHLYVQERRASIQYLLDALPFPVINRPSSGRSNGSKPFQMAWLASQGLRVPSWIVTNEADAATRFLDSCPHGAVVKSCSGLRSHVRIATNELVRDLRIGTAPVVLQAYVPGNEARIHTVRDLVFAASVSSSAIDYRFDADNVAYEQIQPPPEIVQTCAHATRREGLEFAGFDFRVDRDGQWWCLEMNPVPTFVPYEAGSGNEIGDALVDLLAPGSEAPHHASPLATRFHPASFEVIAEEGGRQLRRTDTQREGAQR